MLTGQQIQIQHSVAGLIQYAWYFVHVLDPNTLALYQTRTDALADTNRFDLTANISGVAWQKGTVSGEVATNIPTFANGGVTLKTHTAECIIDYNFLAPLPRVPCMIWLFDIVAGSSYQIFQTTPISTLEIDTGAAWSSVTSPVQLLVGIYL